MNSLQTITQIEQVTKDYNAAVTLLGINRKRRESVLRLLPRDICVMLAKMVFSGHPTIKCFPDDISVVELATRYPELKHIDLTNMKRGNITDKALLALGGCQKLMSINLGYTNLGRTMDYSVEALTALIQKLPNLKKYKGFANNEVLVTLANNCRDLSVLEVDERKDDPVTDDVFERVTPQFPNIRSIFFNYLTEITEKTFFALEKNCPKLESVTLWKCINIGDKEMSQFIEKCRGLKNLDLHGGMGDGAIEAVNRNLVDLTHFSVSGCEISDDTMMNFAKSHPQLTHLSLFSLSISEDTVVAFATHCHELVEVDIENNCMSERSFNALIKNCPNLKRCVSEYTITNKAALKVKYPHIQFD